MIIKEPQDQIIRLKNNETIVKLTCYAEALRGDDLCYEWYCDDSNDIISDSSCAEILFKQSSRNIEKRYRCKVSIADQPEHHVTSRTALIKVEISKLIAHSKL